MEKKLHQEANKEESSSPEQNLITYEMLEKYASKYHVQAKEDIDAFLDFHHKTGDITYCKRKNLGKYIVANPQWLINVFRCLITKEQFLPSQPEDEVSLLKNQGIIQEDGKLLQNVWAKYTKNKSHVRYLLDMMVEFDLGIRDPVNNQQLVIPGMLPVYNFPSKPSKKQIPSSLYFRFHSTKESYQSEQTADDLFMPYDLLPKLESRCAKDGMTWPSQEMYQNFTVLQGHKGHLTLDIALRTLSLATTGSLDTIKYELLQDACQDIAAVWNKLIKGFHWVKSGIEYLLPSFFPNMWFEVLTNVCQALGHEDHECIVSTGSSSLGIIAHEIRCPKHGTKMDPNHRRKLLSSLGKYLKTYITIFCKLSRYN